MDKNTRSVLKITIITISYFFVVVYKKIRLYIPTKSFIITVTYYVEKYVKYQKGESSVIKD